MSKENEGQSLYLMENDVSKPLRALRFDLKRRNEGHVCHLTTQAILAKRRHQNHYKYNNKNRSFNDCRARKILVINFMSDNHSMHGIHTMQHVAVCTVKITRKRIFYDFSPLHF
jgi:hypothetical protein